MIPLDIKNLSLSLGGQPVLHNISARFQRGELVALAGANGAGKTSLLRACLGLVPLASGSASLSGQRTDSLSPRQRARFASWLPQKHIVHWPILAEEMVALGRHGRADRLSVQQAMARAQCLPLAGRRVNTLSGGERARLHLARALAANAPLLLADEPTASLDPRTQLAMMELLRTLAAQGMTIIAVLHDLTLAARFCRRVLLLHHGRLAADAAPDEVFTPARLAALWGVDIHHGRHQGERFLLPWRQSKTPSAPPQEKAD